MKILAVSDQIVEKLYSPALRHIAQDVRLLVGCGDLPYVYLEYLISTLNVPLFYVPGNHDPEPEDAQPNSRVAGGESLDLSVARYNNILFAGLGGCLRYRPDGINQYTQAEMYFRLASLAPSLWLNRLRFGRAADVLVTHSPPFGIHDDPTDPAHTGLKALASAIRWFRPRLMLHGHTHFYRQNLAPSQSPLAQTDVVNVYPYKILEI
jgi:uncharacterized protein